MIFVDELSQKIAEKLKSAILSHGLNQSEVARRADLTLATVSAFCNGHRRIVSDTFEKIIEAIGLPLDHFIAPAESWVDDHGVSHPLNPLQREVLASVNETLARLTGTANVIPVPASATPEQRAILAEIVATIARLRDEEITAMLPGVQALAEAFQEQRAERDARRETPPKKHHK